MNRPNEYDKLKFTESDVNKAMLENHYAHFSKINMIRCSQCRKGAGNEDWLRCFNSVEH